MFTFNSNKREYLICSRTNGLGVAIDIDNIASIEATDNEYETIIILKVPLKATSVCEYHIKDTFDNIMSVIAPNRSKPTVTIDLNKTKEEEQQ